jgi:hypothetical protein
MAQILIIIFIFSLIVLLVTNLLAYWEPFTSTLNTAAISNDNYILPKTIYGYWDLPNDPLINAHIDTWKRNLSKDWQIIILNKDNVSNYVSKEFLNKYQNLNQTRFSDFLRLDLLKNRGGLWVDVSTIIIDGSSLDSYYMDMHKNKYDALVYEYKQKTLDKNIPYLENWFIMAPKNSKYISDIYEYFDKAHQTGFLKYKKEILIPSGLNLENTIGYDDATYLFQHALINYLMFKGNKYNISIKNATDSMFYLQEKYKWQNPQIIDHILNGNLTGLTAIKLTGGQRHSIKNIDEFINKLNTL